MHGMRSGDQVDYRQITRSVCPERSIPLSDRVEFRHCLTLKLHRRGGHFLLENKLSNSSL